MNNEHDVLCSKGLREFFSAFNDDINNPYKLADKFKENYHFIADELPIARIVLHIEAPSSIFEPDPSKRRDIDMLLCSEKDEVGTDSVEFQHPTGDNGFAKIVIYPLKGYKWNEQQNHALKFLEQMLYLLFGRARLGSMMNKTFIIDFLTGAANVKGFAAFTEILVKSGQISKYTSVFMNIKNFNYINRTVGAKEGDSILRKYVEIISNKLNPEEEIIGRLGGDNFILLIKNENVENILKLLQCIRIESSANDFKQIFEVRSRVGIYPIKANDHFSDIINPANIAFQQTRKPGNGDFVWYKDDMIAGIMRSKEVSLLFPQAIANKEFVVYYQPKVTLSNNRLCGCEALVRWFRNGKVVPPMDFIPTLEREGSICRLDFYVLEQVCMDLKMWLSKGMKPFCVSVNFSKAHLRHSDFADEIIGILKKYDIESRYIEVELTESSSYEDYDALRNFIHTMKENGICTSIDDFGTGYSSLNLLKDIDVDIIKLDKSFLDNLESDNRADEIVIKHIVGLVSDLNMNIIAEGVETSSQADFLRSVHCDMAQGYLFDRPLPREEFEKRLLDGVYNI